MTMRVNASRGQAILHRQNTVPGTAFCPRKTGSLAQQLVPTGWLTPRGCPPVVFEVHRALCFPEEHRLRAPPCPGVRTKARVWRARRGSRRKQPTQGIRRCSPPSTRTHPPGPHTKATRTTRKRGTAHTMPAPVRTMTNRRDLLQSAFTSLKPFRHEAEKQLHQ